MSRGDGLLSLEVQVLYQCINTAMDSYITSYPKISSLLMIPLYQRMKNLNRNGCVICWRWYCWYRDRSTIVDFFVVFSDTTDATGAALASY